MKRLLTLLGAAVASGCLAHAASAQQGSGIVVSIAPASALPAVIESGDTLTYDINVSGLKGNVDIPGSPVVGGFDLTLDIDPTLLSATGATYSSLFGPGDFQYTDLSSSASQPFLSDTAGPSAQQLEAQEPAAFTMATVTFEALRSGTGTITFDPSSSMSNENGGTLDVTNYVGAAVPEPSTWALSLLGAAGLCGYTLRRRAA